MKPMTNTLTVANASRGETNELNIYPIFRFVHNKHKKFYKECPNAVSQGFSLQ